MHIVKQSFIILYGIKEDARPYHSSPISITCMLRILLSFYVSRISRSSSMSERSGISSSPGSSGYFGSHLDFRSNISAMHLETDDFFDHQNEDLLGKYGSQP